MRGLGVGLGLSGNARRNSGPSGPVYTAAMQSYLDRLTLAGGTMTLANKSALDAWFTASSSYRAKIKRANFFMSDALDGSLVPQVAVGVTAKDINHNFVGGDHSVTLGLAGDGTTKYIDTGYDPSALGFNPFSFGLGVYAPSAALGAGDARALAGVNSALGDRTEVILTHYAPSIVQSSYNGSGASGLSTDVVPDSRKFYSVAGQSPVDASSNTRGYSDGIPGIAAVASAAWIATTGNITVFARNDSGTPVGQWPLAVFGYVFFSGLTDAEHLAMYNDMRTLFLAIGRTA